MIRGVAGVTIWTDNLDQLIDFYVNNLGLTIYHHHGDFVNFVFGDVRLNLGKHDQVKGKSNDMFRIMISLLVTDIHRTYKHLIEKNVSFIRIPERESWGGWVATFLDPDENVIQLIQH